MKKYERIDNNPLASEFYYPGGETGILMIHGFTASPAQMRRLGEALHNQEYTVLGLLLPGHGTHITDMEDTSWNDWLQGAREGLHRLSKTCKDVYVLGLSMGGALSLILAEEFDIAGVVPIAVPMRLFDPFFPYAYILKLFIRYRDDKGLCLDSENIAYHTTPVRKVQDLGKIIKMAESGLARIKCPMLIVQGLKDRTVKPESAQIIYDKAVNCNNKHILYLEESPHVCTYAPEFERLSANIIGFMKNAQKYNFISRF